MRASVRHRRPVRRRCRAQLGVSEILAGVFYFDLRPVPVEQAEAVFNERPFLAPGLAMTIGAAGPSGSACSFDGRLDVDLTLSQSPERYALGVYEARGPAGLGELIGDWSLAIWDSGSRSVVLASDFAGIRPLYYFRDEHRLLWSSSLSHLARVTGVDQLDERFVASFLSLSG